MSKIVGEALIEGLEKNELMQAASLIKKLLTSWQENKNSLKEK